MKNKLEEGRLEDLVECIRAKTVFGAPRFAMWEAVRVTVTKIFREVYGASWRDVAISQVDVDELFRVFKEKSGDRCSDSTYRMYYYRLIRAFSAYNLAKRRRELSDDNGVYDSTVKKLSVGTMAFYDMFREMHGRKIFTNDVLDNCETFVIPFGESGFVSAALPKGLTLEEVVRAKDLVNGIFAYEMLKRKEEV